MLTRLLDILLNRRQPTDDRLWHKWSTVFHVRLADGSWSDGNSQLWRRRTNTGWEYKVDRITDDEWWEMQI